VKRPSRKKNTEKLNFWQSYSDMMAALLLIFALVLSGTLLEAKQSYNEAYQQLQEQQQELDENQKTIKEQQKKLEDIVGVRSDLIKALKEEFTDSAFSVEVDEQTGAIKIPSNLLFDTNEYKLKEEGKDFLKEFLPEYFGILLGDNFSQYISEIIIEGHTDDDGTYIYNLELSQNRALEVAKYCLDEENGLLTSDKMSRLRDLLTANGKSYSALAETKEKSRRVEIKFRLKDDDMMKELADLFEDTE
jgi:chemotaxis protein MotB